ncbi:MAG TPA: hypothetical protein VFP33_12760, partial [Gallionella sp.]|nr:hypothetical protein [Gallionella sp.]
MDLTDAKTKTAPDFSSAVSVLRVPPNYKSGTGSEGSFVQQPGEVNAVADLVAGAGAGAFAAPEREEVRRAETKTALESSGAASVTTLPPDNNSGNADQENVGIDAGQVNAGAYIADLFLENGVEPVNHPLQPHLGQHIPSTGRKESDAVESAEEECAPKESAPMQAVVALVKTIGSR